MPVNTLHRDYRKYKRKWDLVDCIINNDAKDYIRTVDPTQDDRSKQYKEDAVLTNFTRLTLDGLIGLVFRKAPEVMLPEELHYLFDDCTGGDISLNQFAQQIVGEVLRRGRFGVLVEYPTLDEPLTLKDEDVDKPLARLKAYDANAIINFKMCMVGTRCRLTMVVLQESIEDPTNLDKFESPQVPQYRVLELDANGYYCQTIYNDKNEIVSPAFYPLDAEGYYWDEIPFQFFGAQTNDCCFDYIPLYDLACINLGHYRNSADYEESIFVCGQPMGVWAIAGSAEEFQAANPGGILWGARRGVNVGEGGSGQLLQANPNQLADQAMTRKEAQAAALGARLIAPSNGGRETAEGARIRYGAQNSALYTLTTNVTLGVIQLLDWVCDYMGANFDETKFKLNDCFYDDSTDPQMLMAMMQGYDRGFILAQEVRAYMRETGAQAYLDNKDSRALQNTHMMSPLEGLDADTTNNTAIANAEQLVPPAPATNGFPN